MALDNSVNSSIVRGLEESMEALDVKPSVSRAARVYSSSCSLCKRSFSSADKVSSSSISFRRFSSSSLRVF
jgi:hypothetical protein